MQQVNCSGHCLLSDDLPECIGNSAGMGLCFILGVPGNVAVLRNLIQRLKEKDFTVSVMLSLAVSDLLNLLPLPFWTWAFVNGWIFGSVVCKIISYIEYWCLYSSMLCVMLLSFQRYMQVLHPQKWAKLGDRGQKGLLAGIWILSGVLALYAPVQYEVGCDEHGFQDCFQQFGSDAEEVGTSLFEVFLLLMSFVLMQYFYCRLYRGENDSPSFRSSRTKKLVARIVVAFFVFDVPVVIEEVFTAVAALLKDESLSKAVDIVEKISRALTFLNSCVNPFLYTFAFRKLQRRSAAPDVVQTVQSSV